MGRKKSPSFGWLLGCNRPLGLPQVALDGDCINASREGLAGDLGELLPVRVVLEDGLDHVFSDDPGSNTSHAMHILRLWGKGVHSTELATVVPKQDQVVIRFAFVDLLQGNRRW